MELTRSLAWIPLAAASAIVLATPASAAAVGSGPGAAATPQAGRAGIISTIAGGLGGPGTGRTIAVAGPCGATSDGKNLYFTEWTQGLVRRLNETSDALSIGAGPAGLDNPCAMTTDPHGNLVYADTSHNVLRVIAARNGTFYGRKMRAGHSYVIGGSSFTGPDAVTADRHGNLLVSSQTTFQSDEGPEPGTALVFVLAGARGRFYGQPMVPGHVYPLVGQDCPGAASGGCAAGLAGDGAAVAATLGPQVWGLTTDRSGNVVASDNGNGRIRVVAERPGTFYGIKMAGGDIYTIAGGGSSSGLGDGGPATKATLSSPKGVAFDKSGNLVVTDSGNVPPAVHAPARNRIRVIAESTGRFYGRRMTAGDIYTIAGGGSAAAARTGDGGLPLRATLFQPAGVTLDHQGNLVIADQGQDRLLLLPARTGRFYAQHMTADHLYTIAGNGYASYSGDGGLATRAEMSPFGCPIQIVEFGPCDDPAGLAVGPSGNIVIADSANNRVRVVAGRNGVFYGLRMIARHIYTVAGTGVRGFSGDDGLATRARLAAPGGVTVDKAGNILVSDFDNARVRVIANRSGRFYNRRMIAGHIYYLAGGGFSGVSGIPASKAMIEPFGLAVDKNGNVLIGTTGGPGVLAERTGTFYGQHMKAGYLYGLPGGAATSFGLAIDRAGNIVVAGDGQAEIAVIAVKAGTFYGIRMRPGHVYNVAPGASFNTPSGIAVDAAGNLLIADTLNNRVKVLAERSGTFYGIRMKAGHVYTVAGGGHDGLGAGGRATRAELNTPCGIAPYGAGLVVLDDQNDRVREVTG